MPQSKIVDSWALLAWIRDEPAASLVAAALQKAEAGELRLLMSWINVGEVYYMLMRKHNARLAEEFLERLPSLPIRLVLPGEQDIIAAAKLKASRRVAYADAFAAVLAQREKASLITGDPELGALKDIVLIEWIGLRGRDE